MLARAGDLSPGQYPPGHFLKTEKTLRGNVFSVLLAGAKDGVRTRDLDLGKVALYQLSYFRVFTNSFW
jgi:hypothetical protein